MQAGLWSGSIQRCEGDPVNEGDLACKQGFGIGRQRSKRQQTRNDRLTDNAFAMPSC